LHVGGVSLKMINIRSVAFGCYKSIPSPIGMSDFGFGHHPARIAMTWHPGASKVAVERTMAKA